MYEWQIGVEGVIGVVGLLLFLTTLVVVVVEELALLLKTSAKLWLAVDAGVVEEEVPGVVEEVEEVLVVLLSSQGDALWFPKHEKSPFPIIIK